MRIITPSFHGIIDYLVVAFLLLSPSLFDLGDGIAATLVYGLGVVHLLLTVLTDFPLGLVKTIPFRVHGYIELAVAFLLVPLPWLVGIENDGDARAFFIGFGVAVFAVWFLTKYKQSGVENR